MTDTMTSPLFDEGRRGRDELLRRQIDQPCTNPAAWLAMLHQPCGREPLCDYSCSTGSPDRDQSPARCANSASPELDAFARFIRL